MWPTLMYMIMHLRVYTVQGYIWPADRLAAFQEYSARLNYSIK
jgi:hypothetical protein